VLIVPGEKDKNRLTAVARPRCEVGETLQGGHCELAGEVEFVGLLLCGWHVRRLEVQTYLEGGLPPQFVSKQKQAALFA